MKNISAHVEDFMHEHPFLSKFLRQGIINYKALARHIEPDISLRVGEKVGTNTIAVSLQRLHYRDKDNIYNLIGRLRGVKVISRLVAYRCHDKPLAHRTLAELLNDPSVAYPFAVLIQADSEMLLLIEPTLLQRTSHLLTEDFEKTDSGLAGLVITRELLDGEYKVGGLSYPLQVLAEYGFLVQAVSASFSEEVIIVDEQIADRAAAVLRKAMWR